MGGAASKQKAGDQLRLIGVPARPGKNGKRWGGRRKGAGRKPSNGMKATAPHATRPSQTDKVPLHVSLRVLAGIPRLRQRRGYQIVRRAIAAANRFDGARICEVSIQHNHVHLIVEAKNRASLTRTMKSFAISLAKNVRLRLAPGRDGAVVADRYHCVKLRTPAQVRAALAYVLCNWRRHGEDLRLEGPPRRTDRYSSGPFFAGWDTPLPPLIAPRDLPFPLDGPLPVRLPSSWLLRDGWKQHGLLSPWERPRGAARKSAIGRELHCRARTQTCSADAPGGRPLRESIVRARACWQTSLPTTLQDVLRRSRLIRRAAAARRARPRSASLPPPHGLDRARARRRRARRRRPGR